MKPGILARRRIEAAAAEQQVIQVGQCSGCGGYGGGCSCSPIAGRRGVAALSWVDQLRMMNVPNGYDQAEANAALARVVESRVGSNCPAPYTDKDFDYQNMDTMYSDVTSILAGVGTVTTISMTPQAGCFFAFYWRIVVRDPTSGVTGVDWNWRRPRIIGCPIACDDVDRQIASQFAPVADPLDQRCCGMPLKAFLQRPSEALPLQIPIVNQAAGAQEAQVELRGWCCSTRVC